jgi:hypothetical protein
MKRILILAVMLTVCTTLLMTSEFAASSTTQTFTSSTTCKVPTDGWYKITANGTAGQDNWDNYPQRGTYRTGGKGSYATGTFFLRANTQLTVYASSKAAALSDRAGGWSEPAGGYRGGDAAYVSCQGTPLVIAGGGGGSCTYGNGYNGFVYNASSSGSPAGSNGSGTYGGKGWNNGCYGGAPPQNSGAGGGGGGGYNGGDSGTFTRLDAEDWLGSSTGGYGGGSYVQPTYNSYAVVGSEVVPGYNGGNGSVTIEGPVEGISVPGPAGSTDTVITRNSVTIISGKAFSFAVQGETSITQGTNITLTTGTVTGSVTASTVDTTDEYTIFTGTLTKSSTANTYKSITIGGKKFIFKVISPPVTSTSATVTFK